MHLLNFFRGKSIAKITGINSVIDVIAADDWLQITVSISNYKKSITLRTFHIITLGHYIKLISFVNYCHVIYIVKFAISFSFIYLMLAISTKYFIMLI